MLETEIKKLTGAVEALTAAISAGGLAGGAGTGVVGDGSIPPYAPITADEHKAAWAGYLTLEKQKAGRERAVDSIRPILTHFGVSRITEVSDEQRPQSAAFCKALTDAHGKGGLEAAEAAVKKLGLQNQEDDAGESVL